MKNSIIFKTTFAVLVNLLLIVFLIGWYVYDSQISIINELQTNQKNLIESQLERTEKMI